MVNLSFAALFFLGALATAGMAGRDQVRAPGLPTPMVAVALFCATVLALLARLPPDFFYLFYKSTIVLGLLIAAIAMAFMTINGTPQVVRSGSNVVVYFILWLGFLCTSGRAFWSAPGLIAFLIGLVLCGAVFLALRPRLAWLSLSVLLYTLNAAFVVGGAAALAAVHPGLWSALALIGAVVFTSADAVSAWATWRGPIRWGGLYQALLISFGGLLLALSVWSDTLLNLWPPS